MAKALRGRLETTFNPASVGYNSEKAQDSNTPPLRSQGFEDEDDDEDENEAPLDAWSQRD